MVKRIHKHLNKEFNIYPLIITKFRSGLAKLVEKGMKEYKVSTVSLESLDYFFTGEGQRIIDKYANKK